MFLLQEAQLPNPLAELGSCFGAILKIPGGSTSGGRLAAAKTLKDLGLGIKVSQDGGITGYRVGRNEPAFQVM